MRNSRTSALLALLAGCTLVGCGGSTGDSVAAESEALGASWLAPPCADDGLSSPPGSCKGPWSYQLDTICRSQSPLCGQECVQFNSCATWDNGPAWGAPQNEHGGELTITCATSIRKDHHVGGTGCRPSTNPNSWCQQLAKSRAAALTNLVPEPNRTQWNVAAHFQSAPIGATLTQFVSYDQGDGTNLVITDYTCTLSNVTIPTPATGVNPSCGCALTSDKTCDHVCSTTTKYTAPGAVQPSDPNIHDPVCLTGDQDPYGTAAEASAKFSKLQNALAGAVPSSVSAADWQTALRARLKLLLELRGDKLVASAFGYIQALYPITSAEPACQIPLAVPTQCVAAGNAGGLNALLQLCHNLAAGPHVPSAVVDARLTQCLQLFDLTAKLAAGACRDSYRTSSADVLRTLVGRRFASISDTAGAWSGLETSLTAIDAWYKRASVAAPGDGEWLPGETDKLLKLFWARAYGAGSPLPQSDADITPSSVGPMLDATFNTSLGVDAAVLNAAYQNAAALDSPPLLTITGDALRTMTERLETVSAMHDTACRYLNCDSAPSTLTSQAWGLLSALPDTTQLKNALMSSPAVAATHGELWHALDAVRANHARLEKAYATAGGGALPAMLSGAEPAPARQLAALVRRATDRTTSYHTFGFFLSNGARLLHAGMQNKALVLQQVEQHEAALSAARDRFNNNRVSMVQGLLQQLRGEADLTSLQDRTDMTTQHMTDLLGQLEGLQEREAKERVTYADFKATFDAERAQGVIDDSAAAQQTVIKSAPLSAYSARYDGKAVKADAWAAIGGDGLPWVHSLKQGEELRFQVTGQQWEPTCALQRASIPAPDGKNYKIDTSDAATGPEGYMVQWSNGTFTGHSHSSGHTHEVSADVKACVKEIHGLDALGNGFQASIEACLGYKYSRTWSESDNDGTDNRTTASFTGGIHLDETPVPFAAAGSLLVVSTVPGNALAIVDVQVVARQDVYVAPMDVDTYLVVNDLSPAVGACIVKADKLVVDAVKVTPVGTLALQLATAMTQTLQEIEADRPAILAQGDLLPTESTLLRQHARLRVSQLTGRDVSQLPDAVGALFDTWLSAEIVSLERRARMARLQREIKSDVTELGALAHDVAANGKQSRLAQLIPMWQLRQLADQRLEVERNTLVQLVSDDLPPIFELRYAKALAAFKSSAATQLLALRDIDFGSPGDITTDKLLAVSLAARTRLELANLDSADYGTVMTAVVFPSPASYGKGPPVPNCGLFGTCTDGSRPPATLWRPVDMPRAQQVWNAFTGKTVANFTITPSDLYDPHGGNGRLNCSDGAPVIRNMALFAAHKTGVEINGLHNRPAMQIDPELDFPTGAGELRYVRADTDWLFTGVPLLGGTDTAAITSTIETHGSVAQGLSPFTTFSIDLQNFPTALPPKSVDQLILVFELEVRPTAPPGVAVPGCQ